MLKACHEKKSQFESLTNFNTNSSFNILSKLFFSVQKSRFLPDRKLSELFTGCPNLGHTTLCTFFCVALAWWLIHLQCVIKRREHQVDYTAVLHRLQPNISQVGQCVLSTDKHTVQSSDIFFDGKTLIFARQNYVSKIVNGLLVFNFFQLSNDDFFFFVALRTCWVFNTWYRRAVVELFKIFHFRAFFLSTYFWVYISTCQAQKQKI